jgi:hypothetical protein
VLPRQTIRHAREWALRDRIIIVGVFCLARLACWALGVGFDADNLGTWWQIADVELLRSRLWPTIWALHSQPPLFNLLIGAALRAGDGFLVVMAGVYGLVCLIGILCLHALARGVSGSRWVALALALWFCVSPDVLLFNEKLFYDGLVPWLLCAGFWGVWAGMKGGRMGAAVFGFAMLAAVVLLRSMFHPLWLVATVGLAVWLSGWRWRLLAAALPGLAAVALVLAKNLVVFGFLGLSSWAPLNLVGVTVEKLPSDERAALVASGALSPLSAFNAFGPIERLQAALPPLVPTGEPSLDNTEKANGQPNMNHAAMLAASRLRAGDAIAALRADPANYGAVLLMSLYTFHRPPNEFRDVRRNLAHIEDWARLANATIGLQPAAWYGSSLDPDRPADLLLQVSYGALLITLLVLAAGCRLAGPVLRSVWRRQALPAETVALVLMVWTGAFVFLVSSMLDVLENNRARYTIAPLLTLAAAWYVVQRLRAVSPVVPRPLPEPRPARS